MDEEAFGARTLREPLAARRKLISVQMNEDWDDGKVRLFNALADMKPFVVRKLKHEGGKGVLVVPMWPAQPWYAHLCVFASNTTELMPTDTEEG